MEDLNTSFILSSCTFNDIYLMLTLSSPQPYDLKEFHVAYSREGERENAQFSSVGLNHMRTVLSMMNVGTQPLLPPVCHPQTTRTNRTNPYSFDDYKRDVELRASFFKPDTVVITPALPPPHPHKFTAQLLKSKAAGESVDTNQREEEEAKKSEEKKEEVNEGSATEIPKVVSGSPPSSPPPSSPPPSSPPLSSTAASVKDKEQLGGTVTTPIEDKGHTRKSPSICRSDASFDNSVNDSSLTSYQPPRYHGHSTPMVVGVAGDSSEGVEPMEEEKKVSLTPVRQKIRGDTTKRRPLVGLCRHTQQYFSLTLLAHTRTHP